MNVETGEIKEFDYIEALQKAVSTGKWVMLSKLPDRNCKICYGRGYIGRDVTTGNYIPCKCVKPKKSRR